MEKSILALFFLWGAVSDLRSRTIPKALPMVGVAMGVLVSSLPVKERILALIPGLALILMARLSRGQMGLGDGLAILMAGPFLGLRDTILLLFVSFLLFLVLGGLLLLTLRKSAKKGLPFLPFVLGALGMLFLWGL